MTDNCACNVYRVGGLTVASTETCLLRIIDPDTLETGDKMDLSHIVNIASARALKDDKGDVYNLAGTFNSGIKYHFVKFPASSAKNPVEVLHSASIVATIPSRMKTFFSYYHSFGMTEK